MASANKAHLPGKAVAAPHHEEHHDLFPAHEGDDIPHHGPAVAEPKSPVWLPFLGAAVLGLLLVWWLSSSSEPSEEERAAAEAASAAAAEASASAAPPAEEGAAKPAPPKLPTLDRLPKLAPPAGH